MLVLAILMQVAYPPSVTQTDLQAAIAAATPDDCGVPAADTYTGTAGSGPRCMPKADAARPTQVQTSNSTTAADGTFSGTWPVPFATAPSYARADINTVDRPHICSVLTTTATGYSGKCYAVASTTLPGTLLALGGLVVSPVINPTAGLAVRVIARQ